MKHCNDNPAGDKSEKKFKLTSPLYNTLESKNSADAWLKKIDCESQEDGYLKDVKSLHDAAGQKEIVDMLLGRQPREVDYTGAWETETTSYDNVLESLVKSKKIDLRHENIITIVDSGIQPVIDLLIEQSRQEEMIYLCSEHHVSIGHSLLFAAVLKKKDEVRDKILSVLHDSKKNDQVMLIAALYAKDIDLIKQLLAKKTFNLNEQVDVSFLSSQFEPFYDAEHSKLTPLGWAIEFDDVKLVQFLIDLGARYDSVNKYHECNLNAVTLAARKERLTILDFLINKGARLGDAIIDYALKNCSPKTVSFLLERTYLPDLAGRVAFLQDDVDLERSAWDGPSAWYEARAPALKLKRELLSNELERRNERACKAAQEGDIEELKKIFAHAHAECFVNHINNITPLLCAAQSGKSEAIEFLIEQFSYCGSSLMPNASRLNEMIVDDESLIKAIIKKNDMKCFEVWLKNAKKCKNWFATRGESLLLKTASLGSAAFLKRLLLDKEIYKPGLHNSWLAACREGNKECIEVLLKEDAKLYDEYNFFWPDIKPEIREWVKKLYIDTMNDIELLIQSLCRGEELSQSQAALINGIGKDGSTPLIRCLELRNAEAIKRLLRLKVDVNKQHEGGHYPLYFAVATGEKRFVELLFKFAYCPNEHPECVNVVEAIVCAASCGFEDIVNYLIENTHGKESIMLAKCAMAAAVMAGQKQTLKMLLNNTGIPVDSNIPLWYGHRYPAQALLHFARTKSMVRFLVDSGASICSKTIEICARAIGRGDFQLAAHLFQKMPSSKLLINPSSTMADKDISLNKRADSLALMDCTECWNLFKIITEQRRDVSSYCAFPQMFVDKHCKILADFYQSSAQELQASEHYKKCAQKAVHPVTKQTLLMWACIFGDCKTVERLVTMGLPRKYINKQDIFGRTALMYALLYGNIDCALTLIHHKQKTGEGEYVNHCGSGINLTDMYHRTALFYSVYAARVDEPIEVIKDEEKVKLSKTQYSREYGARKVIGILHDLGAKFALRGEDIALAIKIAAADQNWRLAFEILKKYADKDAIQLDHMGYPVLIRELEKPKEVKVKDLCLA